MAERLLLIDQGNTRLKWLWAVDGELQPASAGRGGFDVFRKACEAAGQAPGGVRFSSVAGRASREAVISLCRDRWGVSAERLVSRAEQGGVRSGYENPESLGVDRWLAIVGAVREHGKPVVVWDLGTAATLDAVAADGRHLGGLILPGPLTMMESLRRDTELPVPEAPENAVLQPGRNTAEAITNGVLAAQVGALNQFLKGTAGALGGDPSLVITGGGGALLLPYLDFHCIHDPWLVFRGMLV
jgi:type III pantothenate kinase